MGEERPFQFVSLPTVGGCCRLVGESRGNGRFGFSQCQPLADGGMVEKVCGGRNGRSRRPSLPHQPFAGATHAKDAGQNLQNQIQLNQTMPEYAILQTICSSCYAGQLTF